MRLPRSARLALRALETTIGPWQPVCSRGAARGGARGSLGSRMDPAERRGGPQPCSGGGRGRYRAKAVQMRLPTCHFAKKRKIVFNKADVSLCLGVTFVWGTLTFVKNIFSLVVTPDGSEFMQPQDALRTQSKTLPRSHHKNISLVSSQVVGVRSRTEDGVVLPCYGQHHRVAVKHRGLRGVERRCHPGAATP